MTDGAVEYTDYDSGLNGSRATLADSFVATSRRKLALAACGPPFAGNPLELRHFPRNLQDMPQKVGSGSSASPPRDSFEMDGK
jgi:hypothetical protein